MSSVFFSTAISIELFLEFFLLIVLSYTVVQSFLILKLFNKTNVEELESFVEKKSYLVSMLVNVSLFVKILLIALFIYALNDLAYVVPGAMCVTGVLNANGYGEVLLVLKIIVLVFAFFWLLLNKADLHSKDGTYFKRKMWLFIVLYTLILLEFILSLVYLGAINTQIPVACCAYKYTEIQNTLPFSLTTNTLISVFYLLYFLILLSAYKKQKALSFLFTTLFIYVSYYAIVYYFGGYIYGDPLHKCPYCMLQSQYNYIGYIIYSSLYLFLYYVLSFVFFDLDKNATNKLMIWLSLFVCILSAYLIIYKVLFVYTYFKHKEFP